MYVGYEDEQRDDGLPVARQPELAGLFDGVDHVAAIKQADELGLTRDGQTVVSLLVFISDVHSMELAKVAQGLKFVTAFYWDRDEDSPGLGFIGAGGSDGLEIVPDAE